MRGISKRRFMFTGLALAAAPALAASKPYWSTRSSGYAADGADVVAYFSLKKNAKAVDGKKQFRTQWKGGYWRFSTAENLAAFRANPSKYAPRYGGYCSLSVALGGDSTGDRQAWHIHQGRLYLNGSKPVRSRWRRAINKYIRLADKNWPGVLEI